MNPIYIYAPRPRSCVVYVCDTSRTHFAYTRHNVICYSYYVGGCAAFVSRHSCWFINLRFAPVSARHEVLVIVETCTRYCASIARAYYYCCCCYYYARTFDIMHRRRQWCECESVRETRLIFISDLVLFVRHFVRGDDPDIGGSRRRSPAELLARASESAIGADRCYRSARRDGFFYGENIILALIKKTNKKKKSFLFRSVFRSRSLPFHCFDIFASKVKTVASVLFYFQNVLLIHSHSSVSFRTISIWESVSLLLSINSRRS